MIQSKYFKVLPYIFSILVILFLYTAYLEEYSKDRIEIKKEITTNTHIKKYIGLINDISYQSYTWRGNDDQMLKYYVNGRKKNAYIFVYYKNVDTNKLIEIKTIEIQLLPENNIIDINISLSLTF